jgi:hypothetical protein
MSDFMKHLFGKIAAQQPGQTLGQAQSRAQQKPKAMVRGESAAASGQVVPRGSLGTDRMPRIPGQKVYNQETPRLATRGRLSQRSAPQKALPKATVRDIKPNAYQSALRAAKKSDGGKRGGAAWKALVARRKGGEKSNAKTWGSPSTAVAGKKGKASPAAAQVAASGKARPAKVQIGKITSQSNANQAPAGIRRPKGDYKRPTTETPKKLSRNPGQDDFNAVTGKGTHTPYKPYRSKTQKIGDRVNAFLTEGKKRQDTAKSISDAPGPGEKRKRQASYKATGAESPRNKSYAEGGGKYNMQSRPARAAMIAANPASKGPQRESNSFSMEADSKERGARNAAASKRKPDAVSGSAPAMPVAMPAKKRVAKKRSGKGRHHPRPSRGSDAFTAKRKENLGPDAYAANQRKEKAKAAEWKRRGQAEARSRPALVADAKGRGE